jgi:hypothetical protein
MGNISSSDGFHQVMVTTVIVFVDFHSFPQIKRGGLSSGDLSGQIALEIN